MKRQAALRQLLQHDPIVRDVMKGVPAREAADPTWLLQYFIAVGEREPAFRRSAAYESAMWHASHAAREAEIVGQVSQAYWGAIRSGLVTQQEADRLIADPAALQAKFGEIQRADPSKYWGPEVQAVVNAHVAAADYEQHQGAEDEPLGLDPELAAPTGAAPQPAPDQAANLPLAAAPDISRQIEAGMKLMRDNPKEYWSEAHQQKMESLYEQQIAAETGAIAPVSQVATATPTPSNGDTNNE